MSSSTLPQKEAVDVGEALVRLGPLDRINESLTNAAVLSPSIETALREILPGVPQLLLDPTCGLYFVASPFNKLKESYRSPWTGAWLPPLAEPVKQAPHLRQLEKEFNEVYDAYRNTHYCGGVSSVYAWPLPSQDGFAAAFLLIKESSADEPVRPLCFFRHHLEVTLTATKGYYKVLSSLLLQIPTAPERALKGSAAALISRTVEQTQKVMDTRSTAAAAGGAAASVGPQHLAVAGPLIERNEQHLLTEAAEAYLPRTAQIFRDVSKKHESHADFAALLKEFEASRPPSSSFSLS